MEPAFFRFDSYDFEADPRFRDGLKLLEQSSSSGDETKQLDMKLFFYNRFVEPIDRTSYKEWRSPPHAKHTLCSQELQDQRTSCDPDNTKNLPTETEATKLSFAEVMRLVQEGKEVPGAKKLDIKPSNQSPTPSQMERMMKPWEIASSAK